MEWLQIVGPIADLGGSGLAVYICYLILTDKLTTRGRLLDERAEKALWQTNAQTQQTINQKNSETINNYAETALITEKVMQTLQERHNLRGGTDSGGRAS